MPKIAYKNVKFRSDSLALTDTANDIISEYDAQKKTLQKYADMAKEDA